MAEAKLAAPIRSQVIPIGGDNLVLPNAAVAEVIQATAAMAVSGVPDWFLGLLSWRERTIALLSFELACKQPEPVTSPRGKIVVLNALGGNPQLNFFALVTQGVPQLIQVDENRIAPIEHETEGNPLILSRVIVNGEPAIIPNLDALEKMLLACKDQWMQ